MNQKNNIEHRVDNLERRIEVVEKGRDTLPDGIMSVAVQFGEFRKETNQRLGNIENTLGDHGKKLDDHSRRLGNIENTLAEMKTTQERMQVTQDQHSIDFGEMKGLLKMLVKNTEPKDTEPHS